MFSGVRTAALVALGTMLPGLASAQVITDPAQATAARDSVLQFAANTRLEVQQRTAYFVVAAPRLGRRRIKTRGYLRKQGKNLAEGATRRPLLWKHVVRTRRNGSTQERFYGYSDGYAVLRETRHNNQLTFLEVTSYQKVPYSSYCKPAKRGLLTRTGYVRWGANLFILPAPGNSR